MWQREMSLLYGDISFEVIILLHMIQDMREEGQSLGLLWVRDAWTL